MKTVALPSGENVPAFGLGAWNIGDSAASRAGEIATLRLGLDLGAKLIDTAEMYGGGRSEELVGEAIAGRRDEVFLVSKVLPENATRKGTLAACERSLQRLRTDRIDLYFSHQFDEQVPIEETLRAYERLIAAGKVRYIGASNHTADQLGEALRISAGKSLPRYEVLQPHYNLYNRDSYEGALRDLAIREGLGVITYFSLASGFLTGKYRSTDDLGKSARGRGMGSFLNPRGLAILAALDRVAAAHGAQPAEVALAWLIAKQGVTAPIASATSLEQMESLVRSTQLKLEPAEVSELDRAGA